MKIISHNVYKYGQIDSIEDFSIPPGAASSSLGWLTLGDRIELVRGRHLLGTEVSGVGRVSGLRVGYKPDGTQVLFRTYGLKCLYYNTTTKDWVEMGSNSLAGAVTTTDPYGEDISIEPYTSLSGAQVWLNSPNSSLFKVMVANPDTMNDQYDSSKNFKGLIKIKNSRMFLWNRGPSGSGKVRDLTGLYGSKLDRDEVGDYTLVSAEAIGLSGAQTYAGTLSTLSGKKTCFGVTITTAGGESFNDDKNGNLLGSLGGTGTINYATGAYSVTFAGVTGGAVTADYYTEDASTNGIADFTKSTPRIAGEGFIVRQDDGGPFQSIAVFNSIYYCLHTLKTWAFGLSDDDATATNKTYRERVGIPNWRSAVETGDGVYFIDDTAENNPRIRVLSFGDAAATEVIPSSISNNLNLSGYLFDKSGGKEWGDYIVWFCRTSNSPVNNRLIAYNRIWNSLDFLPYYASSLENYNGTLVCGDSLSNNAYELFSGLDDDESTIENYWEGAAEDMELPGMKKSKKVVLEGGVGPDQGIRVYVSTDKGAFVEIGAGPATAAWPTGTPAIYGGGAYVDRAQRVDVGAPTVGRTEVGGGSTLLDGIEAYHYKREFSLNQDRFERAKIRYVAVGIGYASISLQQWKDIRHKSNKSPQKYRV